MAEKQTNWELVAARRGVELDAAKRRLDDIAQECDALARDDAISGAEKRTWERVARFARAPLDN